MQNNLELSPDQQIALDVIKDWYKSRSRPYLTLGGYAGTGKTVLTAHLREALSPELGIAFCALTGKAANVLREKLNQYGGSKPEDSISTIHTLMYHPKEEWAKGKIVTEWVRRYSHELRDKYSLIVVDEASMISSDVWDDLLSYEIPILAIGDHAQLPPVNSPHNLMEDPDIRLEHIHRQAAGSPIIELSVLARTEGYIPIGEYGPGVSKLDASDPKTHRTLNHLSATWDKDRLMLCATNAMRMTVNKNVRAIQGQKITVDLSSDPDPVVGERVVCLRNHHRSGIYNGSTGRIDAIQPSRLNSEDWFDIMVDLDGEDTKYYGLAYKPQFFSAENLITEIDKRRIKGGLWTFGYAVTVHKAQGSQSSDVVVFEGRYGRTKEDHRRWLYTAVTRSSNKLTIIGE